MNATSPHRSTLERRQSIRRRLGRRADQALRDALAAVITLPDGGQRTPTPDYPWHDLTRDVPRSQLPCAKERAMLHDAIRQGCTTRDQVLTYHLARIQDDMAQFPDASAVRTSDVLYVRAMAEIAEAQEQIAIAHTMPSAAHRAAAAREGREANAFLELMCAAFEHGETIPFPGSR